MSDPYFGPSGGGSDPYFGHSGGGKKKKHKGGVLDKLGPVGNLAQDLESSIVGIPAGVKLIVTDPKAAAVGIGKGFAQTYAPLFHGDFSGFAHGIYEHPLNPLLDVLSLATLGVGGVARAGGALGRAGLIADTSRLARLGDATTLTLRSPAALEGELGGATVERLSSRNPLIRARQTTVHNLLNRLDYERPVLGELARYGRAARRDPAARAGVLKQAPEAYMHAIAKLSKPERTAVGMLGRVPLPEHLDAWKGMLEREATNGNDDAGQLLKDISKPKVMRAYTHPTKDMLAAIAEGVKLGEKQASIDEQLGLMTSTEAAAARYRHTRIAAGATVYSAAGARAAVSRIDGELRTLKRSRTQINRAATRLRTKGTPELTETRRQAQQTAAASVRKTGTSARADASLERIDRLHEQLAKANDQLERLAAGKEISSQEMLDAALKPGSDLGKVRSRLTARLYDRATLLGEQIDRALHEATRRADIDTRLPSLDELTKRRGADLEQLRRSRDDVASRLTAGRAELNRLASLEGKLADDRAGIRPGIVGGPSIDELQAQIEAAGRPQPTYLPDLRRNRDRSARGGGAMSSVTKPVHESQGLLFTTGQLALDPGLLGKQFLRTVVFSHYRDLHDTLLDSAVEVRGRAELKPGWVWVKRPVGAEAAPGLKDLIPNPDEIPESFAKRGLTGTKVEDALLDHGSRFAVPAKLARQFEAEFQRSSTAARWILEKPTSVWRALVLNLRVGWLTNNIVGNHLLYALRYAGPAGLRGYLHALATTKGAGVVRRLLDMPETKRVLTDKDIAELIPAQAAGTFIGSQMPSARRGGRALQVAGLGLAKADKAVESQLRRAAVNAEARTHPAVKARLRAMAAETRSFRAAAKQALADPKVAREISDNVNKALGDFLSLSPFERKYLRAIFPFYSWYKAVTKIAAKLPLDSPGRTDLLAKLAQVGAQNSTDRFGDLPSYLKGAIPLGDDRLLKTQGLNPLTTVPQLTRAAAAPFTPGARTNDLAGVMNPFVQLVGRGVFGRDKSKAGILADLAQGLFEDLPQVAVGKSILQGPASSKLYEPSTIDDLLAFLGVPTKTIHTRQAHKLAHEGR